MDNQFSFGHILFSTHLDKIYSGHTCTIFEYLIYAIDGEWGEIKYSGMRCTFQWDASGGSLPLNSSKPMANSILLSFTTFWTEFLGLENISWYCQQWNKEPFYFGINS